MFDAHVWVQPVKKTLFKRNRICAKLTLNSISVQVVTENKDNLKKVFGAEEETPSELITYLPMLNSSGVWSAQVSFADCFKKLLRRRSFNL